jgi:hypothetical protein
MDAGQHGDLHSASVGDGSFYANWVRRAGASDLGALTLDT